MSYDKYNSDHVVKNIESHFKHLCSDSMREHGHIAQEHDIDFQVFRALCGYKEALDELAALREAVRRLTKADDDLLTMWDAMADNKQLEDEYHAARAAVDALVGEG